MCPPHAEQENRPISSTTPSRPPSQPTRGDRIDWRYLEPADACAFHTLLRAIETADHLPYRTSLDEVEQLWQRPGTARVLGGWAEDTLRCFALIRIRDSAPNVAHCQGGVHPDFRARGLGTALVTWQTREARRLLAATPPGQRRIAFNVESGYRAVIPHLTALGYEWERSFFELRAPLTSVPDIECGPFLTIAAWGSVDESQILDVANILGIQQLGQAPTSLEQWMAGRSNFVSDWSFVALDTRADRAQIVGFIMASRYTQDWAALGWREGTIDMLGVLPDYRGGEVASALITATMRAQAQAHMDYTAAGLSSAAHSTALSVYDSLGFETVSTTRLYTLLIDEPDPASE